MEKEFIPYDQALELRQLGFDEICFKIYNIKDKKLESWEIKNSWLIGDLSISVPLYQQAFRWFRTKHGYFTSPTESDNDMTKKYDWVITKNLGNGKTLIQFVGYKDSYEEAELECLKKLIELAKK